MQVKCDRFRADRGSPEDAVNVEQVEKAAAAPTPTAAKSTTSHLQKLRAKHVDDSKKVATDFSQPADPGWLHGPAPLGLWR